ncbi:hypothetical protein GLYMA_05G046850v4 [Glycine max]|nr:hypothetical protein GLYMA_05G046850v4 [Glycine max]KAH1132830.1 hypothetical protein GYH30_011587 [Glycine max]
MNIIFCICFMFTFIFAWSSQNMMPAANKLISRAHSTVLF